MKFLLKTFIVFMAIQMFPTYAHTCNIVSAANKVESAAAKELASGAKFTESTFEKAFKAIKPTDDLMPGTYIPKSFEVSAKGKKFWVHPNATKHMNELITHAGKTKAAEAFSGVSPTATKMGQGMIIESFQSAVAKAVEAGFEYEKMIVINGWELIFSKPRKAGLLPVIKHALFKH